MKSVPNVDGIFSMIVSSHQSDSLPSLSEGRSPSSADSNCSSGNQRKFDESATFLQESSRGDPTDRHNFLLTQVIKQLCQVSHRAEDIFGQLKRDLTDIQSRSSRLHDRIVVLETKANQIAATPVPLIASRFPKTTPKCFKPMTTYPSDMRNFFLPSSRPSTLEKIYQQCGKVKVPDDDEDSEEFQSNPVGRSTPLHQSLTDNHQNPSQTDGDKRGSYLGASWFEVESRKLLPTPLELVQSKAQQFAAAVITVDTSGSVIKRLSETRKNELYAVICKPKMRGSDTTSSLNQTAPTTTTPSATENRLAETKWKRKSYAGGYARPRLPPTPESDSAWPQPSPRRNHANRKSLEIPNTYATENEYEWSDDPAVMTHSNTFSNRRKTFNNTITQFLSLRRPKKEKTTPPSLPPKKSTSIGHQQAVVNPQQQSHSSLETDSSNNSQLPEGKTIGSSLKRFLFRSVSLRQPRKTPQRQKRLSPDFSDDLLYENYTPHCHNRNLQGSADPEYANFEGNSHFQLAPPTSQVLQVTNRLRNRLDSNTTTTASPPSSIVDETSWHQSNNKSEATKKHRMLAVAPRMSERPKINPPTVNHPKRFGSVSSYGSNTSLDWNRNNKGGYHRGFQMDYPDECTLTRRNNHTAKMEFLSDHTEPRCFYSDPSRKLEENDDFSLGNSSAFSCDQDGYYTSMHIDSGIQLRRTASKLKSISFAHPFGALNSSDENDTSRSGSLTSSINPSPATVMPVLEEDQVAMDNLSDCPEELNLPPPNPNVFNLLVGGIEASPPTSENHLVNVDVQVHSHSDGINTRKTVKIGSREIADDLLDDWLLQKFKLESNQCHSAQPPTTIPISPNGTLPSPTKTAANNCSLQANKQFLTFPRKTVRFCD